MPVGIGIGRAQTLRPGVRQALRFAAPASVHAGALWLATAAPAAATLLLVIRLAS